METSEHLLRSKECGKMITNSLPRGSLLFFLSFFLLFSMGFTHYGKSLAQPVLHQGNHWWEAWRFRDGHKIAEPHAHIYYRFSEQKVQAALVAAEAQRVLHVFEKEYGFTPDRPVPIFLFPDRESMRQHFSWSKSQSASGVYYSGSIYLLNPEVWYKGFPQAENDPHQWRLLFREKGPLMHEVAHLYLDRITGGNYPLWYTEAFAQWVEYDQLGYEWIIPANQVRGSHYYSYELLRDSFDQLDNQALAYRQSFLLIRHMVEEHGIESLHELHRLLAQGNAFESAWEEVFAEPTAESHQRLLEQLQSHNEA
jgi:hypothetical protein